MFWVKGLVDFFDADRAFLVRDRVLSDGARQLASRLSLGAYSGEELIALTETFATTEAPIDTAPLSGLFSQGVVSDVNQRLGGLAKNLDKVKEFRQFDYWIIEPHRKLVLTVDTLYDARQWLDPQNPIHVGIFLDYAWLFVVAVAQAASHLLATRSGGIHGALSEYIAGGTEAYRQKSEIAGLLGELQRRRRVPGRVNVDVNPPFFDPLAELLTRLVRRNDRLTGCLRILEWQSTAALTGNRATSRSAFGENFDVVAAKLAVDVTEFITKASELSPLFAEHATALILTPNP